jgi:hypothetical protein
MCSAYSVPQEGKENNEQYIDFCVCRGRSNLTCRTVDDTAIDVVMELADARIFRTERIGILASNGDGFLE